MAKVGRKALLTPTTAWKCYIPVDLAAKVDLLLLNPVKGTPGYGARSSLVTELLRAWIEGQVRNPGEAGQGAGQTVE